MLGVLRQLVDGDILIQGILQNMKEGLLPQPMQGISRDRRRHNVGESILGPLQKSIDGESGIRQLRGHMSPVRHDLGHQVRAERNTRLRNGKTKSHDTIRKAARVATQKSTPSRAIGHMMSGSQGRRMVHHHQVGGEHGLRKILRPSGH